MVIYGLKVQCMHKVEDKRREEKGQKNRPDKQMPPTGQTQVFPLVDFNQSKRRQWLTAVEGLSF